ncbi:hypothetical protein ATC03_14185 [Agromyces aureus]|uniref:LGFP repeat-containing protein n=1 Tax=Agromyces aureus TaxID=453304 RepID=A0A191WHE9_9MICO|nr:hypothetical protein ATC03_14185 [Agromyces aureus]
MDVGTRRSEPSTAANLSLFDPGNIIDDSVFFDGTSMSPRDVQNFLESKVGPCRAGYTCLKDYREATRNIAPGPLCNGYVAGPYESAADIISKVGNSCGISPKVLLVTLQKEQGLVTDTWPTASQYRIAMGMGCPDTAACDSEYFGFFNQVYGAAAQFKRYANPPGTSRYFTWYEPGRTWNVRFHPNAACGSAPVYIRNQATANLYYYTPYQPNRAALAAGYGTGDGCSAYGNRNFYQYFVDWFGSVRGYSVGTPFQDVYNSSQGSLGYPTRPYTCGLIRGGCYQVFTNGWIVDSAGTQPQIVALDYRGAWWATGNENGYLGYPTSNRVCGIANGGCYQTFEGGWIVHSASTPIVPVTSAVRGSWWYYGNENGFLGYPLASGDCSTGAGCVQVFQGGAVSTSSVGGVRAVRAEVLALWNSWGRERGVMGFPSGDPPLTASPNYTQAFSGGVVQVKGGVAALVSSIDPWANTRVTSPWLGGQVTSQLCDLKGGACHQEFAGGWMVKSPAGVSALPPAVLTVWFNWGREWGILGFPTSGPSAAPETGNYTQNFQGGVVTVTGGVGKLTSTVDPWFSAVLASPWLGQQTTSQVCDLTGGACRQEFAGGWMVQSRSGAFAVPAAVVGLWNNWGRERGIIGFPTGAPSADPASGAYTQSFQGGVVTVSGGVARLSSTTDPWFARVLASPWLGPQTTSRLCDLKGGACRQVFSGGWMVQSPSGAYAVPTAVLNLWFNYGREWGDLGFPTGPPSANPESGNYTQSFQGGVVKVTNGVPSF